MMRNMHKSQAKRRGTKSPYKGVYRHSDLKCKHCGNIAKTVRGYYVQLRAYGKMYYLGPVKTALEGAELYNRKALEIWGSSAVLNNTKKVGSK